jgi:ABC-type multidrug transport system permease subunit
MRSDLAVARAVAWRSLQHAFKNPALLIPSIIFPLIFLVAFAGGLSAVRDVPGFHFHGNYTAFQFVFVFLQSAAFGGVFTGFGIAADFESGFARRMLLAAPHRTGMLLGYAAAGMVRWAFTATMVTIVALLAGMTVYGTGIELTGLIGVGLVVNVASTLFGAGVSFRTKTLQAGPLMQVPIFVLLFLAPVYVPLSLLNGWIHTVASYNPMTALLTAGRGFLSGVPDESAIAFACGVALVGLMALYAVRGLRRAERGL